MTIRLNDLQRVLLAHAAQRKNGSLLPLPENCTGENGRIGRAITGLIRHGLVEERPAIERTLTWREQGEQSLGLFITATGRVAIGVEEVEGCATADEIDAVEVFAQITVADIPAAASADVALEVAPRPTSKIGLVQALLRRDQGATLAELVAATGWQPHTTRAALTGLRHKGHVLAKTKREGVTCYHLIAGTEG